VAKRKVWDVTFDKKAGEWKGEVRGGDRATVRGNKAEVVKRTTTVARNAPRETQVVIRKKDNTIQEERTYPRGSDPRATKG
jgi:hypothetical protein